MKRVAITGVGVVAPGGTTKESFWSVLISGKPQIRRISHFDASEFRSQIAAEIDFDPLGAGLTEADVKRMDRYVQFGVAAAVEAMADSGILLQNEDKNSFGVAMGSAVGGTTYLERDYVAVSQRGKSWIVDPRQASEFLHLALVPSTLASEISCRFGLHGPAAVISTGCTAGIDAIGYGFQLVQEGEATMVVAGAAESGISPISMACFDPIGATSRCNDDPVHASRPFDRDRDGFVMGEGGAALILEDLDHALARGAKIYGEIRGFSSRSNAFHMTGLRPDGLEMAEAIRDAMRQAQLSPADLDYINAHGSGTQQNDRHETAAFKAALGDAAYHIPVSSIKSMVGHSLGGIGAIEVAACALAMERGIIPPTANLEHASEGCDLDYTPVHARKATVNSVLSTASGFGGFQSAIVLSRVKELS